MQKKKPASLTKAQATYGQYLSALTAGQPSPEEQKYAWQQYQRLFDINHRAMDQARTEALARQMARGR